MQMVQGVGTLKESESGVGSIGGAKEDGCRWKPRHRNGIFLEKGAWASEASQEWEFLDVVGGGGNLSLYMVLKV